MKYFNVLFLLLVSVWASAQTTLDTAVSFTVKDVEGNTHRLNEYLEQDKIVVIDFFTITCGPCVTYAPEINASYNHFGNNTSQVVFLGINWGAINDEVADFGETYGAYYPEISGIEGNGNHVVADYNVLSYPTVIVILPNYLIAEKYIWPPSTHRIDSIVQHYVDLLTPVEKLTKAVDANTIISIFPQPATDLFSFNTSVSSPCRAQVMSVAGKVIIDKIDVMQGIGTKINTQRLPAGYYILLLLDSKCLVLDAKPIIIANH